MEVTAPAAIRCELNAGNENALVFAEVCRRAGEWKVRVVGQGYSNGLAGLATDYGVSIDEPAPMPRRPPETAPISLEKKRLVDLKKKLAVQSPQMLGSDPRPRRRPLGSAGHEGGQGAQ